MTPADQHIVDLYNEPRSMMNVARTLGINESKVWRAIAKARAAGVHVRIGRIPGQAALNEGVQA